jgi:DNA (cytosine-5)-methyltransferase 1
VGHSQHNGSSSSTKSRSFKETSDDNQERKNEAGEFAGAGRSNGSENVENTRRTLRQGSLFGTENANETGQEDANQFERSSSTSENGISNTNGSGLQGLGSERELREGQEERSFGWERWWELEPNVGRVANGVSKRMDRLKGLGNSLVPAIPFIIGNSILETEKINDG